MKYAECPVVATDHDSAMVQADWYEEQGSDLAADEIRLQSIYELKQRFRATYKNQKQRSSCSTSMKRGALVSFCCYSNYPSRWSNASPFSKSKASNRNCVISASTSRTSNEQW